MKRILLIAACTVVATSLVVNAGDVDLRLVDTAGNSFAYIYTGQPLTLEVRALVTPNAGEGGLALFGFDFEAPPGVPLSSNQFTSTLTSFVKNEGLSNPDGFGGTLSGHKLLQVGGGQNTIGYTGTSPAYPTGTVVTGIGLTETTIATIVLDTWNLNLWQEYTFQISNGFANLIDPASQPSAPPYTVSAANMLPGSATFTASTWPPPDIPPALVSPARSWKDHGTTMNGTVLGRLAIEIPLGVQPSNRHIIEPRQGSVTEMTLTFDHAIDRTTFRPADIQVCGLSSTPGHPATADLDPTGTVGTVTFAANQIPNGHGDNSPGNAYVLVVGPGVRDTWGNSMDPSANKVYFAASFGNVNKATAANWRNVNPNDRNQIVANYNVNPTPAQAVQYDVYLVGAANRGKINPNDANQVVASYSITTLNDLILPTCP